MVDPKLAAWSISRLSTFEQCPYKFYLYNITKQVKDFGNEATEWGKTVHKALELRLKDNKPLPKSMHEYEPWVRPIENAQGQLYTEQQLALNRDLQPCTWFDRNTYVRSILDIARINQHVAWVGDWKTGSMKYANDDQLKLFAVMIFQQHPSVSVVKTNYLWLKEGHVTGNVYERHEADDIWAELLPRDNRIEQAVETNVWQAKPSRLCDWCSAKKQGICTHG